MKKTALLKLADALESEHGELVNDLIDRVSSESLEKYLQTPSYDLYEILAISDPKETATRIRKFVKGEL